jgi:hypothetical protein
VGFDPSLSLTEDRNGVIGLLSLPRLKEFLKDSGMYGFVPVLTGQNNNSGVRTHGKGVFIQRRLSRHHDAPLLIRIPYDYVVVFSLDDEIAHVLDVYGRR